MINNKRIYLNFSKFHNSEIEFLTILVTLDELFRLRRGWNLGFFRKSALCRWQSHSGNRKSYERIKKGAQKGQRFGFGSVFAFERRIQGKK